MTKTLLYIVALGTGLVFWSCHHKKVNTDRAINFTKVDSLTETYLTLQDSLLHAWNVMAWDDNEKIKSMHGLIHLMHQQKGFSDQTLISLEQQLDQLDRIRFTQKSVSNTYLIKEYDFASQTLFKEIVQLLESDPSLYELDNVKKNIEKVQMMEQRAPSLRLQYNETAGRFNLFLDSNRKYLKDIDKDCTGEKIAVFEMGSN